MREQLLFLSRRHQPAFRGNDPQAFHADERRALEVFRHGVAQHPLEEIDLAVDRPCGDVRVSSERHVRADAVLIDRRQQLLAEHSRERLQEPALAFRIAPVRQDIGAVGRGVRGEAHRRLRRRQPVDPRGDVVHALVVQRVGQLPAIVALSRRRPDLDGRFFLLQAGRRRLKPQEVPR